MLYSFSLHHHQEASGKVGLELGIFYVQFFVYFNTVVCLLDDRLVTHDTSSKIFSSQHVLSYFIHTSNFDMGASKYHNKLPF